MSMTEDNMVDTPQIHDEPSSSAKRQKLDDDTAHSNNHQQSKNKQSQTHTQLTLRKPQYTYFHLVLKVIPWSIAPQPTQTERNMDILTLRQNMNAALSQFLGLMGTAIQIDILKFVSADLNEIQKQTTNVLPISHAASHGLTPGAPPRQPVEAYVRVSKLDADAVQEAISAWTGRSSRSEGGEEKWKWVIKGRNDWLVRLGSEDGQALFGD